MKGDHAPHTTEIEPSVLVLESRVIIELIVEQAVGPGIYIDSRAVFMDIDQTLGGGHPIVVVIVLYESKNEVGGHSVGRSEREECLSVGAQPTEPSPFGGEPYIMVVVLCDGIDDGGGEPFAVGGIPFEMACASCPGIQIKNAGVVGAQPEHAIMVLHYNGDKNIERDAGQGSEVIGLFVVPVRAHRRAQHYFARGGPYEGEDEIAFQIARAWPRIIMTYDLTRSYIHDVQSVFESADPQFIAGGEEPMYIGIGDIFWGAGWHKMPDEASLAIELIQPGVLGAYPYIIIGVLAYLADGAAADGTGTVVRIALFEDGLRVIVDASKVGASPYTPLGILTKGIDGIVGKGVGIEEFLSDVGDLARIGIDNVYARLGRHPEFVGRVLQYIPDINGRPVGIVGEYILVLSRGGVKTLQSLVVGGDEEEVITCIVYTLHPAGRWRTRVGEHVERGEVFRIFIVSPYTTVVVAEPNPAFLRLADAGGIKIFCFGEVFELSGGKIIPVDIVETEEPEIALIVRLYPVDLYQRVDDPDQFLLFLVESEEAVLPARPERAIVIAEEAVDHVAAHGALAARMREQLEMVPVKSVEPCFCAEPEKAIFILCSAEDRAVGETVLYLEMPEVVGLCRCPAEADNDQKG